VSAGGIKVDTSNRVVKQIFDFETSRVINDVELISRVGGEEVFGNLPSIEPVIVSLILANSF
jgi:hypothetical protein